MADIVARLADPIALCVIAGGLFFLWLFWRLMGDESDRRPPPSERGEAPVDQSGVTSAPSEAASVDQRGPHRAA